MPQSTHAPARPILFGAGYSVYVRAVRLALAEKDVQYDMVPVDVFVPGGPPADHLSRHPFGKIPAFEHDGFRLYETTAIERYVDEAFDGPPLTPATLRARARMTQAIGVLDNYVYPFMVWGVYAERVSRPAATGRAADETKIAAMLPKARICLAALTDIQAGAPFLAGDSLSLADLHAAPMFAYFLMTAEGEAMIGNVPDLQAWWRRIAGRESMALTDGQPR